jgi:hypothetical protein
MNCQKNIIQNNTCAEFDSMISDDRDIYKWKISIFIDELKYLLNDLFEITKENFPQLSKHLSYMISIIDKVIRNMKPITPNSSILRVSNSNNKSIYGDINNSSGYNDRGGSIQGIYNQYNKKNENMLEIIKKDFITGINNLFEVPYLYILFSKRFRDMFRIYNIYSLNRDYNEEQNPKNEGYKSDSSNSNQSILENLLN